MDQLFGVGVTDVLGLAVQRVSEAHRNRHVRVFVEQVALRLGPLRFGVVRFEIVENGVGVSSRFFLWQRFSRFFVLTLPFLDHAVAGHAESYYTRRCCGEHLISCPAVIYDLLPIIRKTSVSAVPETALVFEYCSPAWEITINRRSSNPFLATVSA